VQAAHIQASARGLNNVTFVAHDLLRLGSKEERSDLVRSHLLFSRVSPEQQQALAQALVARCAPGGLLLVQEWNLGQTTSGACYQWLSVLRQAALRAGSAVESIYGMANRLRRAGCASVEQSLEHLDVSAGTAAYASLCEGIIPAFDVTSLFLLQHEVLTSSQLRDLRTRLMIEVLSDTFQWKWTVVRWLGQTRGPERAEPGGATPDHKPL
jgi:hypothetical protein